MPGLVVAALAPEEVGPTVGFAKGELLGMAASTTTASETATDNWGRPSPVKEWISEVQGWGWEDKNGKNKCDHVRNQHRGGGEQRPTG